MNKYAKEIMTLVKENFEAVVGKHQFQTGSEARSYYLEVLDENLHEPMGKAALKAYG